MKTVFRSTCGKKLYKTDKCPECGTATRKKSRKNGDKPRISLDFEGE